jgi:hypothetical protein
MGLQIISKHIQCRLLECGLIYRNLKCTSLQFRCAVVRTCINKTVTLNKLQTYLNPKNKNIEYILFLIQVSKKESEMIKCFAV